MQLESVTTEPFANARNIIVINSICAAADKDQCVQRLKTLVKEESPQIQSFYDFVKSDQSNDLKEFFQSKNRDSMVAYFKALKDTNLDDESIAKALDCSFIILDIRNPYTLKANAEKPIIMKQSYTPNHFDDKTAILLHTEKGYQMATPKSCMESTAFTSPMTKVSEMQEFLKRWDIRKYAANMQSSIIEAKKKSINETLQALNLDPSQDIAAQFAELSQDLVIDKEKYLALNKFADFYWLLYFVSAPTELGKTESQILRLLDSHQRKNTEELIQKVSSSKDLSKLDPDELLGLVENAYPFTEYLADLHRKVLNELQGSHLPQFNNLIKALRKLLNLPPN